MELQRKVAFVSKKQGENTRGCEEFKSAKMQVSLEIAIAINRLAIDQIDLGSTDGVLLPEHGPEDIEICGFPKS